MAERWTQQRRLAHTRNLLLDAAEEVFAQQGFGGAALEDIAAAAGYTRGAIYAHFGAKEELFLAVIERHLQRFLDSFEDVISTFDGLEGLDVEMLVTRWRELALADANRAALGYEFSLFLLRNPDARERLAAKQRETVRSLAGFITTHTQRLGASLAMPAETLARILIASNEGITLHSHLDGQDLYGPFLQMVMANVSAAQAGTSGRPRAEAAP